jgi:hypothetical protein
MSVVHHSLKFVSKLIIGIVGLVITVMIGYMALYRSTQYSIKDVSVFEQVAAFATQPLVDVFGNTRVGREYTIVEQTGILLTKSEFKRTTVNPGTINIDSGALSEFTDAQPAAVLKPKTYTGEWHLGYCTKNISSKLTCYYSKVITTKEIAFQNRTQNSVEVFGLDTNNQVIDVQVTGYVAPNKLGSAILI